MKIVPLETLGSSCVTRLLGAHRQLKQSHELLEVQPRYPMPCGGHGQPCSTGAGVRNRGRAQNDGPVLRLEQVHAMSYEHRLTRVHWLGEVEHILQGESCIAEAADSFAGLLKKKPMLTDINGIHSVWCPTSKSKHTSFSISA